MPLSYAVVATCGCLLCFVLGWLVAARRGWAQLHRATLREAELREELAAERAGTVAAVELREAAERDAVVELLHRYSERLETLEQQRQRESAVLGHAVAELRRSNEEIRDEARRLGAALHDTTARGAWGEVQLRRVLELSGLQRHVDFDEQLTVRGDGGVLRPDAVVHLPNGRCVVIDAKAPLEAYLRAANAEDGGERSRWMDRHAEAVADHVRSLGRREYDRHVEGSVDFVVLFVPGDAFLSAAFDRCSELFELAARHDVVLAAPSTLLGFLRGVASGWRERQLSEQAAEVAALGRELHERLCIFGGHLAATGAALERAVEAYNATLGSYHRRLLVSARRLESKGAESGRALPEPRQLEPLRWSTDPGDLTHGGHGDAAGEVSTSTSSRA